MYHAAEVQLGGQTFAGEEEDAEVGEDADIAEVIHFEKAAADSVEIIALSDAKTQEAHRILQKRRWTPAKALHQMVTSEEAPLKEDAAAASRAFSPGAMVSSMMPIVHWAPKLTLANIKADMIAGLTVGVMAIPQGMSYANIAGLEYIYGMYSACVPTFVYAFFGESRQLAVGPVAMVSLLVEAGLRSSEESCLSDGGTEGHCQDEYTRLAILTSLAVGLMQLVASILRLGFLVSFLGHPVTSGFTSAAAIIIGLSQVKYIFGFDIKKSQYVYETIGGIIEKIDQTKGATLVLGILSIAFLMTTRKISQTYKERLSLLSPLGPLILCVIGIFTMWLIVPFREEMHVKVVGDIPQGFMPLSLDWKFEELGTVLPTAMSACLIGYMESIAIGKNLAAKNGYTIEAGQELLALGMANLVGAMFSCYPVTGSFSRSAVNQMTGAQTQLAGLITSLLMLLTLVALTPLFYYLPKFVLAAIVINSVIPLVAYKEAVKLYVIKKQDFALWIVAFLGTMFLGVLMGIALAVLLSLVIVVYESVRPQITILWRIPGTAIYRNVKQETSGAFVPNMFIVRIGSSMYFANASYIKDTLSAYVNDLEDVNKTEYIVLEMTSVISIDSTAAHILHDIVSDFRKKGIYIAFAMVGNRVEKTMKRADLKTHIGENWFFTSVNEAVQYCCRHQHARLKRGDGHGKTVDSFADEFGEAPEIQSIPSLGTEEVGFHNDIHPTCTAIIVYLYHDATNTMSEILTTFSDHGITVIRAQVEPLIRDAVAKHMYFVRRGGDGAKLTDEDIEQLRASLGSVLQRQKASDLSEHGSVDGHAAETAVVARLKALEDSLVAERAETARAQQDLLHQQQRMEELLLARSNAAETRQRDSGRNTMTGILPVEGP